MQTPTSHSPYNLAFSQTAATSTVPSASNWLALKDFDCENEAATGGDYYGVNQLDARLLAPEFASSDPDLYLAKIKLEERLKMALMGDYSFSSPLSYIERFFESAFSQE